VEAVGSALAWLMRGAKKGCLSWRCGKNWKCPIHPRDGFFYSVIFADEQEEEIRRYLELLICHPKWLVFDPRFGERQPDGLVPNGSASYMRLNRDFHSCAKPSTGCTVPGRTAAIKPNRVFLPAEADLPGTGIWWSRYFQRVAGTVG
jgi:hypothetical protein